MMMIIESGRDNNHNDNNGNNGNNGDNGDNVPGIFFYLYFCIIFTILIVYYRYIC
jgi:hypothetical protein